MAMIPMEYGGGRKVLTDTQSGTTSSSGLLLLPSDKDIIGCSIKNSVTNTAYMGVLFKHKNGSIYCAVFDLAMVSQASATCTVEYYYLE